jgi:2-C-methyl-D-erythritol 4-phosphate cytidylyltransferase
VYLALPSHVYPTPETPQCALYSQLQAAFELASSPVDDRMASDSKKLAVAIVQGQSILFESQLWGLSG